MESEQALVLEVLQFLHSPAMRTAALDLLLGLSTSQELVDALRSHPRHLQPLCSSVGEQELKVLTNISREGALAQEIFTLLRDNDFISSSLPSPSSDYFWMLLCNLCKVEACREFLLQPQHLGDLSAHLSNTHVQYILIDLSISGNVHILDRIDPARTDDFTFSVLKNLLFELANHTRVLNVLDKKSLIAVDSPSMAMLEFLLLLCTTELGRNWLRECNIYDTLRRAHAAATEDAYREAVERVVDLIIRDEEK